MHFVKGLILLILYLLVTDAFSQQVNFRHLNIDDGLSQNAVYSILQDSRGFMWFGTKNRLNRYDGRNFVVYQHDPFDSTTISDAYVTRLLADSRGDIWTGSLSGVVNVFERETGIFCTVPIVNKTGEKVTTNEITDIDEVPLIAENFLRVILNLTNNAFDAMREKMTGNGRPKTGEKSTMSDDHRDQATNVTSEFPSPVGEGQGEGEYRPKLTIRTHQAKNTVTIEIADNGPGIPDEIKDNILHPFFTTKKGTQGTGLGLSITNDIIKAHGGQITIKTKEHDGTLLTIELPF